ncbi:hypothetical protein [Calorimonas adulescens]|uniref:Uncharacterized protein n=1 Tax=Calorimonas adulescens TaxID=2606906 RepID=A0A5D8QDJ7_9THEO|nr:hypothetical protein [Calorimonas adulescens]TZE82601.1 hypothetical protein FWJ32_04825 [Calorimonas adulescens]
MEQIGKNHEEAGKYISAEDVNRFCYCPYQYYYSLTVNKIPRGTKKISKRFKKGKKYHKAYDRGLKMQNFIRIVAGLASAVLILWIGWKIWSLL